MFLFIHKLPANLLCGSMQMKQLKALKEWLSLHSIPVYGWYVHMTYQPYIIINIEKLELLMQGLFCRLKQMCIILLYTFYKFYNDIII